VQHAFPGKVRSVDHVISKQGHAALRVLPALHGGDPWIPFQQQALCIKAKRVTLLQSGELAQGILIMRSATTVYDDLLRHQAQASFPLEQVLFAGEPWESAHTVVDVGCGNGEYTRLLAEGNADKHFLALEPDAELYALAKRYSYLPNLRVLPGTLDDLPDDFQVDVLLARLVLIHVEDPVKDPSKMAQWARNHTMGSIIVNPADDLAYVRPMISGLDEIVANEPERLAPFVGRQDMGPVTVEAWRTAGHDQLFSRDVVLSATSPGPSGRMLQLMLLNAELNYGSPLPADLYRILYEWSVDRDSYVQYGLRGMGFRVLT
jgi:SAM-dependent methyltransferase